MVTIEYFQLFRRVAAALPGMEQTEQKKEDSILNQIYISVEKDLVCKVPSFHDLVFFFFYFFSFFYFLFTF